MASTQQIKRFIEKIGPLIQKEAQTKGYIPSPIIAQACLESGYGTSTLGYRYHNYFGMKCGSSWKGKSVNLQTSEEYTPGVHTIIKDDFRVFDSMEDGVKGYFTFISTKRYENLKTANTPKEYLELIKKDGYATSSTYVESTMAVVNRYDLTKYDKTIATKKSNKVIAQECIEGKWGNGAVRKKKLTQAGYNYEAIQKLVNELLKK